MNRFPWIRRFGNRESRSRRDGGTSNVAGQLSALVTEYRNESMRWAGTSGDVIWENAWQLDTVRLNLLRGTISADDARQWVAAGWTVLDRYQFDRSRRNHPASRR